MPALKRSLSVVIPAYNEQTRLGPTLDKVIAWCAERYAPLEVLVVDDGSTDDTVRLAESRGAPVRVLRVEANRGKGHAVRRGMLEAQHELVLFTDADLSTPIEELQRLEERLDGAPVVIGSRAAPDSRVELRQPLWRMLMGKTFNRVYRALLRSPLKDTQCGFKLFTRDAARDIFSHATVDRFAFDVEAIVIAQRRGWRVEEVGVRWINSPDSRVHPLWDSARMLWDVLRVRWRHRTLQGTFKPSQT